MFHFTTLLSVLTREWFLVAQTILILISGLSYARKKRIASKQSLRPLFRFFFSMTILCITYLGLFAHSGNWALVMVTQGYFLLSLSASSLSEI